MSKSCTTPPHVRSKSAGLNMASCRSGTRSKKPWRTPRICSAQVVPSWYRAFAVQNLRTFARVTGRASPPHTFPSSSRLKLCVSLPHAHNGNNHKDEMQFVVEDHANVQISRRSRRRRFRCRRKQEPICPQQHQPTPTLQHNASHSQRAHAHELHSAISSCTHAHDTTYETSRHVTTKSTSAASK